ncbi:hypothetical protein FRB93_002104 [Tulasnella sp. JGI-2019a]|nr:hypothetical protein FRB93_002104 [Tulasnella sp. JGI-2019a]
MRCTGASTSLIGAMDTLAYVVTALDARRPSLRCERSSWMISISRSTNPERRRRMPIHHSTVPMGLPPTPNA